MARSSWYDIGPLTQLPPGEGRVFRVEEVELAVFRTRDGRAYATQASCPHKGGPLADGLVGGGKVVCPLHGYKFDLATGCAIGNVCERLKTYPVAVSEQGHLLLTLEFDSHCEGPDGP